VTTADSGWNEWQLLEGWPLCSDADLAEFERTAAALGVNAWECALLESIWYDYGQVPSKTLLADRAFGIFQAKDPSKAIQAIERCFADGLIQFLTADFLLEMKAELDAGGYLQPVGLVGSATSDMDAVGLISFTRRGVELHQKWIGFDPATSEHWTHGPQIHSPFEIYGTSEEWCGYALPSYPIDYALDGPAVPIGRWSDRWWNRFESGYRLTYTITNEAAT
jgi:hypothetical protein